MLFKELLLGANAALGIGPEELKDVGLLDPFQEGWVPQIARTQGVKCRADTACRCLGIPPPAHPVGDLSQEPGKGGSVA